MSGLQQGLAVVGGLITIAAVLGGLWAVFRTSAQDVRIKYLEAQRNDYLSRLNFIEPKLTKAEEQNRILLELHNPSEQIKGLAKQEQENHARTFALLTEQSETLKQIEDRIPKGGGL